MEINILIPRLISLFLILLQIFPLLWINWHIYLCLWPILLLCTLRYVRIYAKPCISLVTWLASAMVSSSCLELQVSTQLCYSSVTFIGPSSVSSWLILIKVRLPCFFSFKWYFCSASCIKSRGRVRQISCFKSSMLDNKYALTVQGKSLCTITQIKTLQYILSISSTYIYANNISLGVHTRRIIGKEAMQQLLF